MKEAPHQKDTEEEDEAAGGELRCSTELNSLIVNGATELVSQLHTWWDQLLAVLAPRLGATPAALEALVLSKRFTIAALCASPLVMVEGGGALVVSSLVALAWLLVSLVLGPLPTLCRFVALPFTQTRAFVRAELLPFLMGTTPPEEGADDADGADGVGDEPFEKEGRRTESRLAASASVQFELLLAATKSLVPLLALVCTGTRLPGFWGALVSGQLLRRVKVLPPELLHLLLVGAGALHTLLGVSSLDSSLAQGDSAAATGLLQLQWQPSVRDVLSVCVVALLGATAASAAGGGGSEPLYCVSFAAGVAMRMAFYDVLSPRGGVNAVRPPVSNGPEAP